MKKRSNFVLIGVVVTLGFAGSIFFFPFNFNNRFTCLYHRLFADNHGSVQADRYADEIPQEETLDKIYLEEEKKGQDHITGAMHSEFVNRYVRSFGLMWWLSLTLLALGLHGLRRQRKWESRYKPSGGQE